LWTLLGIVIAVPVIAALAGVKVSQFVSMGEAAKAMAVPPEIVTSFEAREEEWQPRISSVGSVMAVQGTIVSTEAEGVVRDIKFEAGSTVKQGDLLVQLDVDTELAQLREAQATAELAKVNYSRAKELIESRNISQQEFDKAAVEFRQALAKIENIQTLVNKKTVKAPFAGRLGIKKISIGQFLPKGSEVVSLQALDPIYVDFSLPQQRLDEIKEGLKVEVTTDAYPDAKFEGKVTAVNPDIDPTTRNVRVQATLNNADGRLRPGMFASVDLVLNEKNKLVVIPQTAVQHAPFGDSVFVIVKNEPKKKEDAADGDTSAAAPETTAALVVKQQIVRLGNRQGDFVAVTSGLEAGQRIVSTGVFKLKPGTGVEIDNKMSPDFKLHPSPGNT
jgi:membrane fusion protein (multidrug efflux system)